MSLRTCAASPPPRSPRRLLPEQHALGTDHVGDVVVDRPSRTVRRGGPLLDAEPVAQGGDVGPDLVEPVDHRLTHRSRSVARGRSELRTACPLRSALIAATYRLGRRRETGGVTDRISFYFDPMCPYAYTTSRWIRTVRSQRDLEIDWRFFSLEEVNRVDGKKHPWDRPWSFGFGQMRVGALIRRELGNDAVDRWYAAVGNAFFFDGVKTHTPEPTHRSSRRPASTPRSSTRAIDDPSTLTEVRDEHLDAVARYRCPRGAHDRVRSRRVHGVRAGGRPGARR